ncbi:MAG: transcriptional antiterminator [Firmicutes bacterium]|nr:transcriptional antiterminator [Bacillota bacterium]
MADTFRNIALSKRVRQVLQYMIKEKQPVSVNQIARQVETSKRSVYYDLKDIESLLAFLGLGTLQVNTQGYYLTLEQSCRLTEIVQEKAKFIEGKDRINYIICSVIYPQKAIRIMCMAEIFGVSKNTVINDLAQAKDTLAQYQLTLCNTKKRGYYVEGEIFRKRSVLLYYFRILLRNISYKDLQIFNVATVDTYYEKLQDIFSQLNAPAKDEILLALACLIISIQTAQESYNFIVSDLTSIYASDELKLVESHFPELSMHERFYLAIHLIGNRTYWDFVPEDENYDIDILKLSKELVDHFEVVACLSFQEKEGLIQSIFLHLKLSFYICHYSVQMINPLMDEIKKNYSDLYQITKQCCDKMIDRFPFPIFDSEITYLTMHFGAFLIRNNSPKHLSRVLIVCPNGRISSMLLKNEIECHFVDIQVAAVIPLHKVIDYKEGVDFVISTVDFPCQYPLVLVNPILTGEDKSRIASFSTLLRLEYQIDKQQFVTLLDIVRKYVNNETLEKIQNEICFFLNTEKSLVQMTEHPQINLPSMLKRFGVRIEPFNDICWEQAISETAQSLLLKGYITQSYIDQMISLVHQHGSYIVIHPRIAIAHAKPENGVRRLGVSLAVYPNGLSLGHHTIQFLFVMATPNQNDHLHILQNIVSLSQSTETMDGLVQLDSGEEIIRMLETLVH